MPDLIDSNLQRIGILASIFRVPCSNARISLIQNLTSLDFQGQGIATFIFYWLCLKTRISLIQDPGTSLYLKKKIIKDCTSLLYKFLCIKSQTDISMYKESNWHKVICILQVDWIHVWHKHFFLMIMAMVKVAITSRRKFLNICCLPFNFFKIYQSFMSNTVKNADDV